MSELGVRLKTAREEAGFSLDELQQRTKIQKRYLQAIEEGDFSKMPGEFYARAFVKRYCEAVGLQPDLIFEEHENELPKPKAEKQDLPPRTEKDKTASRPGKRKSKMASLVPSIVVLLFLIGIIAGVWFVQQGGTGDNDAVSRDEQQNSPSVEITDDLNNENEDGEDNNAEENNNNNENNENNEDNENGENNANNDNNENESEEQDLAAEDVDGSTTTYSLSQADDFTIDLEFTADSWINISNADDEDLHESTHSDGDEISFDFSGESEIIFNIGNTYGTEIYVNDELLEYERDDTDHQYIVIQYEESS
ncbi:helix-turn-helix domain-containing protein [Salisediminibacterium halotolerans]|uniref:Protein RodZ, contains Xre-like HTH and DUF4115 domains n=1 Tax=Salisediminibacterium halotolerans TaxID=517425 RepID=A0A1H9QA22_9BACI|nr:RodZ family helix-turn-helix domain-containing protein [Salisediminibacterium haloalkalitolerans]SER57396.1 protein RodZ, contains Xre-like HTH and DUF4115 domains [Salisediminibacterium haloalkalitolerans]